MNLSNLEDSSGRSSSLELKRPQKRKKRKLPKHRGANTARKSSVPVRQVDESKRQQQQQHLQSERLPSPLLQSCSSSEPTTVVHSLRKHWGRSELNGRRAVKEFVTFVSCCVRTHLNKNTFEPDQFYSVSGCISCLLAVEKDAIGQESQHYFMVLLTARCNLWLLFGCGAITSSLAAINEVLPLPLAHYATLVARQKRYRKLCSTLRDSNLLIFEVSGLEDDLVKCLPLPNLHHSLIGFACLQALERDLIEASCHAVADCIFRLTQSHLPPPPSVSTTKAKDRPLWCYERNQKEQIPEQCPFCGTSFSSVSMPNGVWTHLKKHEEELRRRVPPSIVQDHMQRQLTSNLRLRSVIERLHIETANLSNQYKLL